MILMPNYRGMDLRIVIATPSPGTWTAGYGLSLAHLMTTCNTHRLGEAKSQSFSMYHTQGSMLSRMRLECVRAAKQQNATHLLFIDSDHTFPRGLLWSLLRHQKQCVAINCVTKMLPANTTARYWPPEGSLNGAPVYSRGKTGIEKVWRVGTGIMLLSQQALFALTPNSFDTCYRPEVDDTVGEDWRMAEDLERAGIDIWVDHDMSQQVGHIGSFEFRHEHVKEVSDGEGKDSWVTGPGGLQAPTVSGPGGRGDPGEAESWEGSYVGPQGHGVRNESEQAHRP